jgi:hypothetical protein
VFATLAFAALIGMAAAPAQAARPFNRAVTDDVWWTDGPTWIPKTVVAQPRVALLEIDWAGVEPSPPTPGWDPSNPSAPNYNFTYVDNQVRQWAHTGVSPAFLVTNAPAWATPGAPPIFVGYGSYRPNATAFGQLARALARRYSGSYPDPAHPGQNVPRVRYFQAWAEANFSVHLAPQWVRSGGSWVATSPDIYRNLLNAFYAGIKSVHSDNVVITAGFGPFGDPPGGNRIPPALFVRDLLCLNGRALSPAPCSNPAHFDALAIDPYEFAAPTQPAYNVDDVTAPDLGKLTRIVNKAVRTGRALPFGRKQLWVTEFSYDSNPPNPTAVSTATQARWLEQAFYLFWKQGVNTAVWYLIRDQAGTNYNLNYFSGIYFHDGRRKPSFEAFRFPLVVMPSGRRADVWGISPRNGLLVVQRQRGSSWRTLFRVRASAGGVFTRSVSAQLRGNFRAVVGGESSLVWRR